MFVGSRLLAAVVAEVVVGVTAPATLEMRSPLLMKPKSFSIGRTAKKFILETLTKRAERCLVNRFERSISIYQISP
jgi:hypothetical protein